MTTQKRTWMQELFFPRRCVYCNRVIGFSALLACEICLTQVEKIKRLQGLSIQKCGRELQFVSAAYAPFYYESPVKNTILRMKFGEFSNGLSNFGNCMINTWNAQKAEEQAPIDFIIAVPATPKERKGRHRNVSQILAQMLSEQMQIPLSDALYKQRETKHQMALTGAVRRQNVKDAFAVAAVQKETLQGKTVLLIDDVLTTGSTVNECAKALCEAGVATCFVLVVAVTRG